jgi:hypothetical protein
MYISIYNYTLFLTKTSLFDDAGKRLHPGPGSSYMMEEPFGASRTSGGSGHLHDLLIRFDDISTLHTWLSRPPTFGSRTAQCVLCEDPSVQRRTTRAASSVIAAARERVS